MAMDDSIMTRKRMQLFLLFLLMLGSVRVWPPIFIFTAVPMLEIWLSMRQPYRELQVQENDVIIKEKRAELYTLFLLLLLTTLFPMDPPIFSFLIANSILKTWRSMRQRIRELQGQEAPRALPQSKALDFKLNDDVICNEDCDNYYCCAICMKAFNRFNALWDALPPLKLMNFKRRDEITLQDDVDEVICIEDCDKCVICMEEFKGWKFIQPFGICDHIFHHKCIVDRLFENITTCPVCAQDLSSKIAK